MGERKNGSSGVKGIISHPPSASSRHDNPCGQAVCGSCGCEKVVSTSVVVRTWGFFVL